MYGVNMGLYGSPTSHFIKPETPKFLILISKKFKNQRVFCEPVIWDILTILHPFLGFKHMFKLSNNNNINYIYLLI